MNFIPVKAGDCYLIKAGTVHAIGAGCVICEIQQNSNVTYRVYDYNRHGTDGKLRPLHVEKAVDVINFKAFKDETNGGEYEKLSGKCDGMSQYLSKRVDDAVLQIVRQALEKIKGSAKDEAIKTQYEKTVKEKKEIYLSLKQKMDKEQTVLNKLVSEVGRALIGESAFTIDVLNASISATKEKLAEYEKQIPQAYKEYTDKNEILEHLDGYYDTFKSWADEFATASQERKKMIICKLIDRIEIGKGYEIRVKMNINYEQFL